MHPRNKHNSRYDFTQLIDACPELKAFVFINQFGSETIDFANPAAVKILNQAILKSFYGINYWDIPSQYLCPPIPGRADYVHYVADLLSSSNKGIIPTGKNIKGLDIGVGANCVYPLIGEHEYRWSFIGSDIDLGALASAKKIVESNEHLKEVIQIRHQESDAIFNGIVRDNELIDFTICNPPFHSSAEEAAQGTKRKLKNLGLKSSKLNFGGKSHELWCEGGEISFINRMIEESEDYQGQCLWFTTLVSKKDSLSPLQKKLNKISVKEIKVIEMTQGQKISRILAWSYKNKEQQLEWTKRRWT